MSSVSIFVSSLVLCDPCCVSVFVFVYMLQIRHHSDFGSLDLLLIRGAAFVTKDRFTLDRFTPGTELDKRD